MSNEPEKQKQNINFLLPVCIPMAYTASLSIRIPEQQKEEEEEEV
jgi:hypothetical protein